MTSDKRGGWGPDAEILFEIQSLIQGVTILTDDPNGGELPISHRRLNWISKLSDEAAVQRIAERRPFDVAQFMRSLIENWCSDNNLPSEKLSLTFDSRDTVQVGLNRCFFEAFLKRAFDTVVASKQGNMAVVVSFDRNQDMKVVVKPNISGFAEARVPWGSAGNEAAVLASVPDFAFLRRQLGAVVTHPAKDVFEVLIRSKDWMPDDASDAGPLVLLVSSDQVLASQIGDQLEPEGIKLLCVTTYNSAVNLISGYKIDALLVDDDTTSENAAALAVRLRAQIDVVQHLPIVVLASTGDKTQYDYLEAHSVDRVLHMSSEGKQAIGEEMSRILRGSNPETDQSAEADTFDAEERLVIDVEVLGSLRGSVGPEVFDELLLKLHADLMVVRSELKSSERDLDLFQIRRSTHVLISLAGSFGATELQMTAQKLNIMANQEKRDTIRGVLEECMHGLELFIAFVVEEQSL